MRRSAVRWNLFVRKAGSLASSLDEASLEKIAGEVGLDQAKFDRCLANKAMAPAVDEAMADASAVGVRSTPAFFINGRMIPGAQPFEEFKVIIDEEIAGQKQGAARCRLCELCEDPFDSCTHRW